jgi:hypothetical protein
MLFLLMKEKARILSRDSIKTMPPEGTSSLPGTWPAWSGAWCQAGLLAAGFSGENLLCFW